MVVVPQVAIAPNVNLIFTPNFFAGVITGATGVVALSYWMHSRDIHLKFEKLPPKGA